MKEQELTELERTISAFPEGCRDVMQRLINEIRCLKQENHQKNLKLQRKDDKIRTLELSQHDVLRNLSRITDNVKKHLAVNK